MVDEASTDQTATCGSLLNAEEFRKAPKALLPSAFPRAYREQVAGRSFTLSNLPAVTQQGTAQAWGSPGSCEAQSFGYGLGSFTAALNPDGSVKWDASQPGNEASAAWLYKWALHRQGESCPKGTLALPYLGHLVVHGCPTVSDVKYKPLCSYLNGIPLDTSYPDAGRMRIGSYYAFEIKNKSMLSDIQLTLMEGSIIAFSGLVLKNYTNNNIASIFNCGIIYDGQPVANTGHGQLLVGWNDDVGPANDTGAFLVQNSFGTSWPPQSCGSVAPAGMAYWSYDTFFASQQFAAIALPLDPTPFDNVSLTAQNGQNAGSATAVQVSFTATNLIIQVQFDSPLLVNTITLVEPGTGSTMQGQFNQYMNNGWLYFRRDDGNAFLAGDWQITIGAQNAVTSEVLTLSGAALTVPAPGPESLQQVALSSALVVYDTIGDQAEITIGN